MSRFNELYRGAPGNAADQLEDEATEEELRAALINTLRRIERIESQLQSFERLEDA